MATDTSDSWTTTSAFVSMSHHDSGVAAATGHRGTPAAVGGNIGSRPPTDRHRNEKFLNTTASALVAAVDDITRLSVSTAGGDADNDELPPGLLWLPYVIFTIVLFSLIALSFVRFHCQRGHQYRRRQAELSDKRPYRQLQQPTPDHFRLLGSESGSAGGGHPNGGLSGNYIPEQMNLFVQYSQVVPDDYLSGVDENTLRSSKKNGSGGKRGGLNRRPLVFTFNSNGSMVDIRCDEEERTNTFRLVPNADSAGGEELEVQEIDLGNGELDDIEPSLPTQLPPTPLSSATLLRQLPLQFRGADPLTGNSLNIIPPPPAASSMAVNRASMLSPSGGGSGYGIVNGRERTTSGAQYTSSNHSAATTATTIAQSHQNHVRPPALSDLTMTVTQGPLHRLTPAHPPSMNTPPPRPSTSSSSNHKPPMGIASMSADQQRMHLQQHARSSPTRHHHPTSHRHHQPLHDMHHMQQQQQQHRHHGSSTAAASTLHPNHHPHHHGGAHPNKLHNYHHHYSPLDVSEHNRKDLYGEDEDEGGLNCAAEALLLWQKRV